MKCMIHDCERVAIMAVATRTPANKQGLVNTIYQFEEDAPKMATRTCGAHGVELAAGMARLCDGELQVKIEVTGGAPD